MKLLFALLALLPIKAFAHVKWFSDYSFNQAPLDLSALNHPTFWGLFALSVVSLPLIVWTDKLGEKWTPYQKFNSFLDQYSDQGPLIMRITMAAVLLMSWQGDSVVAPEIPITHPLVGWIQFAMALCLLFRPTTIITGSGMIILFLMNISSQGMFHMLDYMVYPAVGLYLVLSHMKSEKYRNLDLPVLYCGLGFSLCWVAFEKMIYPFWGLSVLEQAPALTMGLNHEFFLLACSFIEFTLGYLLIICLLHRPLAVVITLVFFTTTSFFGKTEVVGHTILHGALLVFIVKGPGHYYQAPIRIHKSLVMRSLFAMVNFAILFAVLIFPYQSLAKKTFAASQAERAKMIHEKIDLASDVAPTVMLHAFQDSKGGWNLQLMTSNFKFTPELAGKEDVLNEGHAHLYVDGKKVGRVYSEWFHLTLGKGKHKIKVTLNSNSHKDFYVNGEQIVGEIEVEEGRDVSVQHHH